MNEYFNEETVKREVKHFVAIEPFKIGKHTYVGEFTHISQNTNIGNFCSIANLCTLGAQGHPTEYLSTFPFEKILQNTPRLATIIGSDVWIGSNSVVLEGVNIGDGAVIGGGSVITRNVPAYAIAVGNPARVLRYRFPQDIIDGLLETQWWNIEDEIIRTLPVLNPAECIAAIRLLTGRV